MAQKTKTQTIKKKKSLSMEEVQKKVEKTAKEILVFTEIKYKETKGFNIDGEKSTYLIFGLYNKRYNCWNSATYDVENDAIDFRIHRVTSL